MLSNDRMKFDIGRKLFPNASPWQRQRWMVGTIFGVIVGGLIICGMAYFTIKMSRVGGRSMPTAMRPLSGPGSH
jgi:hypothetical protein